MSSAIHMGRVDITIRHSNGTVTTITDACLTELESHQYSPYTELGVVGDYAREMETELRLVARLDQFGTKVETTKKAPPIEQLYKQQTRELQLS